MATGGIGGGIGNGITLPLDLLDGAGASTAAAKAAEKAAGTGNFAAALKDKLVELNAMSADSAAAAQDMATGRVDDIAQTMLRIEQASVSMQMATQVRNKVIEAYQEVLRMQM
jgi:flagellar hook-basal body complex protein FliE